jgi:hypothetical protein
MGQSLILPTRNPLFLVPFGYGLGTMAVQLWEVIAPKEFYPWEFRHQDAINEGRIPSHVSLEEFRAKYDDYGVTPYIPASNTSEYE